MKKKEKNELDDRPEAIYNNSTWSESKVYRLLYNWWSDEINQLRSLSCWSHWPLVDAASSMLLSFEHSTIMKLILFEVTWEQIKGGKWHALETKVEVQ